MIPAIYIDLDETLIHSQDVRGDSIQEGEVVLDSLGGMVSACRPRPLALTMLSDLRSIAPTCLLTSARRSYALDVNRKLGFDFKPEEIIAREDFLTKKISPGAFPISVPIALNQSPRSILIDDLSFESAHLKTDYLGIPYKQYFQISAFYGVEDDEFFLEEWRCVLVKIRNLYQM